MNSPKVTAVIVGRNRPRSLSLCVKSLQRDSALLAGIYYIDTGSEPSVLKDISESLGGATLVMSGGGNPQVGRNMGASLCRTRWVLFCDDDVEVTPGTVRRMIEAGESHPQAALVGARRTVDTSATGSPRGLGSYCLMSPIWIPREGAPSDWDGILKVYSVRNLYLIRKDVLEDVGGWPSQLFIQFDEVDLCYRIHRAGYDVLCLGDATYIDHTNDRKEESREVTEVRLSRGALNTRNCLYEALTRPPLTMSVVLFAPIITQLAVRALLVGGFRDFLVGCGSLLGMLEAIGSERVRLPPETVVKEMRMLRNLSKPTVVR